MPQYTRANTTPGSPERKQVYAREYAARARKSEHETGLSYTKQRRLRELYPVSTTVKSKLERKYGKESAVQGTRYAVHRAHIARGYERAGKSLTPTEHKAVKVITGMPNVPGNPLEHLRGWYANLGMPFAGDPGERWAEAVERSQDWGGWEGALRWEEALDMMDFSDYDLGEYSG
jgi:hypothetical protein